jgi:hypothetical protein
VRTLLLGAARRQHSNCTCASHLGDLSERHVTKSHNAIVVAIEPTVSCLRSTGQSLPRDLPTGSRSVLRRLRSGSLGRSTRVAGRAGAQPLRVPATGLVVQAHP